MKFKSMILCQFATDSNGLINILGGGITTANAQGFPTLVPFTVVIRAAIEPTDMGVNHYSLSVRSSDGAILTFPQPDGKKVPQLVELNANIQKNPAILPDSKEEQYINLIAQMNGFFDKAGDYQIRCDINGASYDCPLYVKGPIKAS